MRKHQVGLAALAIGIGAGAGIWLATDVAYAFAYAAGYLVCYISALGIMQTPE